MALRVSPIEITGTGREGPEEPSFAIDAKRRDLVRQLGHIIVWMRAVKGRAVVVFARATRANTGGGDMGRTHPAVSLARGTGSGTDLTLARERIYDVAA